MFAPTKVIHFYVYFEAWRWAGDGPSPQNRENHFQGKAHIIPPGISGIVGYVGYTDISRGGEKIN
jgi:hypothetical protein